VNTPDDIHPFFVLQKLFDGDMYMMSDEQLKMLSTEELREELKTWTDEQLIEELRRRILKHMEDLFALVRLSMR
jgi:hypothetical protein